MEIRGPSFESAGVESVGAESSSSSRGIWTEAPVESVMVLRVRPAGTRIVSTR